MPFVEEWVKSRPDATLGANGLLFPELIGTKSGDSANKASQWLSRWLSSLDGLSDRDRTTAHSWRHSVQDALRHAGVADDVRRQLLGHAGVGLAAGYGLGHNLPTLRDAVNGLLLAKAAP